MEKVKTDEKQYSKRAYRLWKETVGEIGEDSDRAKQLTSEQLEQQHGRKRLQSAPTITHTVP